MQDLLGSFSRQKFLKEQEKQYYCWFYTKVYARASPRMLSCQILSMASNLYIHTHDRFAALCICSVNYSYSRVGTNFESM